MTGQEPKQPDLVDDHFRPFVRALGNLVITFALCESELLKLVAAMVGGDETRAVATLKDENAKDAVIALVQGLNLPTFETDKLVSRIEGFWRDKEIRNRLIHDEWFPHLFRPGAVFTRGITRAKTPKIIFGNRSVDDAVSASAARFPTLLETSVASVTPPKGLQKPIFDACAATNVHFRT
jgi:hypothetical protein